MAAQFAGAASAPATAFVRVMWDTGVVIMPDGRHCEMLIQSNLFHGKLRQLPLTNMQTLQFGLRASERWHLCNLTISGGGISCQPVNFAYKSQKKFLPTAHHGKPCAEVAAAKLGTLIVEGEECAFLSMDLADAYNCLNIDDTTVQPDGSVGFQQYFGFNLRTGRWRSFTSWPGREGGTGVWSDGARGRRVTDGTGGALCLGGGRSVSAFDCGALG